MEIWKEIEDFNGDYFISNLGRVKSFKCGKERILTPWKNSSGYFYIILCKNGKRKHKKIHILMYEGFIGKITKGCVVHHKDFTKNNILENFQIMTDKEHRILHMEGENNPMYNVRKYGKNNTMFGKHPSEESKKLMSESHIGIQAGEKHPNSILKEQDIIEIRKLCDEGILTQAEIAEKFGVGRTTISAIKNNKIWRHI